MSLTCSSIIFPSVNKNRIQNIQDRVKIEEPMKQKSNEPYDATLKTISALQSIQCYSQCFPYMNSCKLIHMCASAWEALSARNYAAKQSINRKLMAMKMDPKADPIVMEHLEVLKSDYGELVYGYCRYFKFFLSLVPSFIHKTKHVPL